MTPGTGEPKRQLDDSCLPIRTSTRAVREREVAAYHRDLAALARWQATTTDAQDQQKLRQTEAAHTEIAMLHDRLADVYDREDGTSTSTPSTPTSDGRQPERATQRPPESAATGNGRFRASR